MKTRELLGAMALVLFAVGAWALRPVSAAQHTVVTPADMTWEDAPPTLARGAKMSVLYGEPSKSGLFVVRFKLPANYTIMPHTHPTDENVTVLSGGLGIGVGERLDPSMKALPAGTFISLPAKMPHYAFTNQETIFQLSAMGPFAITYLDPADDPSKSAPKGASSGGNSAE